MAKSVNTLEGLLNAAKNQSAKPSKRQLKVGERAHTFLAAKCTEARHCEEHAVNLMVCHTATADPVKFGPIHSEQCVMFARFSLFEVATASESNAVRLTVIILRSSSDSDKTATSLVIVSESEFVSSL